MPEYDVIVVGAGNAALAAAVSAREQGAGRVVVLEKAPPELRGGNTHYSGGLFRFAFDQAEYLRPLVPDAEQDFQLYTYAKLGGIILNQPGGVAWQIFDQKVTQYLEGRYKTGKPVTADTLKDLVGALTLDHDPCLRTLEEYNAAAESGHFDPTVHNGLATPSLELPKSNWAQRLDSPPFVAYPVTGGITFGGVKINDRGQVLDTSWEPIPGLYACGEMVGGLFHVNYPGGTGLMSGAVFGRLAGANAAGA